ncbi:MAG: hypothetical protein KAS23_14465, partial [Anaerohalosphaera sp.]|nr:hypothetical protein [Anaerohalosphaera sp.]
GFSPCWDITCFIDGLEWGDHKQAASRTSVPAGKALNVSRGLAQLKAASTAAGLWGNVDSKQMVEQLSSLSELIKIRHTKVKGATRQNITIVDTRNHREMHLTSPNELANSKSVIAVEKTLKTIIDQNTVCVFSGSMPTDKSLAAIAELFETVKACGADIVLDTSGAPLRRLVSTGSVAVISPNLDELGDLLGKTVPDTPAAITKAVKPLLRKVKTVLVSRGAKGAIAVTGKGSVRAKCTNLSSGNVTSTVGCGDYLLAGFLAGLKQTGKISSAVEKAVTHATAKAWGLESDLIYEKMKKAITVITKHNY